MAQHHIAVIGSLNVDFIIRTPRVPGPGETLAANSFHTNFGGKGANQAVACARLADSSVKVSMVGNLGDDGFGADYFEALKRESLDGSHVRSLQGHKTGISTIIVDDDGENRILFVPNANHAFSQERGGDWNLVPEEANVVVFQLEMPSRVVYHNVRDASRRGKHVILNPAPAEPLPEELYKDIDTLIMNESESRILSSNQPGLPIDLAKHFLSRGVKDAVIITLGGDGLVYATVDDGEGRVAAKKVEVVDTTAAGDTFVGGYAVQRAKHVGKGFQYQDALEFATLAASKAVQRRGAMDAIPTRRAVVMITLCETFSVPRTACSALI